MTDEEAKIAARNCDSMDEVRFEIDRLDRILVRFIAERQSYIEAAARIKDAKSEVHLEWRIEDVVAKVLKSAETEGLSPRIAEPVWRQMIASSIEHEHKIWDKLHSKEKK